MAIKQIRTFDDIREAIREEVQFSSSDTNRMSRVERDINAILQEVAATKNWWWLNGSETLQLPAYISAGTVSVTAGSSSITFTEAPAPSCRGYLFAVDGYQEIYRIESHTAGATTAKLDGLFNGATDTDASFKVWRDRIPLPTDCKETIDVFHDHHAITMEGKGLQEYRRIVALNPKCEGKPRYYYTGDFCDPTQTSSITSLSAVSTRASSGVVKTLVFASSLPSSLVSSVNAGDPVRLRISKAGSPSYNGDILVSSISTTSATNDTLIYTGKGELQESSTSDTNISVTQLDQEAEYDRYRELFVYPHLNNFRVTLHVDYIKQVLPLSNDDDEPVIPIEDRMVLVYGALSRVWARERNPDEAARNYSLYQQKLAKMAGKLQDTQEAPTFRVSREYLRGKRSIRRRSNFDGFGSISGSGSSSSAVVTGRPNTVAVFDTTGEIGGSTTISTTELEALDGIDSNIQDQIDAHLSDSSGAHAASAISNTPSGNLEATTVQGAINELQTQMDARSRISVKEFGALGDNSTDDTDAIQAALDYAGANNCGVYFPKGTYLISDTLNIGTSTFIEGEATASTIIKMSALPGGSKPSYLGSTIYTPTLDYFPILWNNSPIQWFSIRNIWLHGNDLDVYGLRLQENFYGDISHVTISNCNKYSYINIRGQQVSHRNCSFYQNKASVLTFDNTTFLFDTCGFERTGAARAVQVRSPVSTKCNVSFKDCWFEDDAGGDNTTESFLVISGRNPVVENCYFAHNGSAIHAFKAVGSGDALTFDGISTANATGCIEGRFSINCTTSLLVNFDADSYANILSGQFSTVTDTNGNNLYRNTASTTHSWKTGGGTLTLGADVALTTGKALSTGAITTQSSVLNVQDSSDTTKKLALNASGNTTGKTLTLASAATVDRTLSLPDATDTLVGKATTDTLTNKTIDTGGTNVIGAQAITGTSGSGKVLFQTSPTITTPTMSTATIASIIDTSNLLNIKDSSDNTKILAIDASGNATGTKTTLACSATANRTATFPDATGTVTLNDATQTLTNKTIAADSNTISGLTNSNLSGSAGITVANGGTGRATLTNHGVLVGAGTSGITQLAAAAAGTVLTGQGTGSDPAFTATPTLGVAGTTLGTLAFSGNTSGTTTLQPAAAASGTLSLPATTDTLVGKATTDTLTNKTIDTGGTNLIGSTSITGTTGTAKIVFDTTPTVKDIVINSAVTGSSKIRFNGTAQSCANNANVTFNVDSAISNGLLLVANDSLGEVALFMVYGAINIAEISDPANKFSTTAGTGSSCNVTVSTTSGTTVTVENKEAGAATYNYRVAFIKVL